MLTDEGRKAYYIRMGLREKGVRYIEEARLAPSRNVQSRGRNVTGKVPSKTMGETVQYESRTVEGARIYELDHLPCVLEFYDQPPYINRTFFSAEGRQIKRPYMQPDLVGKRRRV